MSKNSSGDKVKSSGRKLNHKDYSILNLRSHLRLWIVAAAGTALDLASKYWAVNTLIDQNGQPKPINIIDNYLSLLLRYNEGAVWSIAKGKTTLLIVTNIFALIFLFLLFALTRAKERILHLAFGLLLAGALGNLYDRLFNAGKVVDFIEVNLHFWPANPWPTFNIADVLLCIGVGVMLLNYLVYKKS